MKLSTNFVKDYIDIDVDVKTLAEDMTRVGNEYDLAQKFYQNNINSSKGKKAKEYLHNRSISDEIIKEFGGEPWEFLKSLDALIDGPFILKKRDLSLKYRGSSNQRLLHLRQGTGEIVSVE